MSTLIQPEIQVYGQGSESAKIMFVGDYATPRDAETGRALNDYSGEMLERLLKPHRLQLKSSNFYRTLAVKEPLKGFGINKKRDKQILQDLAPRRENYDSLLLEEINAINPNVIVPIGELALKIVCGERGIFKFRGSVLPISPRLAPKVKNYKNIKCIPIIHPRDIHKDWSIYAYTQIDFQKIVRKMYDESPITFDYLLWICRDASSLNNFLSRSTRCAFAVSDIETFNGFVTCLSFCFDGKEAVSIPLMDDKVPKLDLWYMWKAIKRTYNDKDIKFVNQNIGYDDDILRKFGLSIANIYGDTMLFGHTLYPELPKGLDFLNSIYTDIPYYKDEGKEFDPKLHTMDQLYYYNAKDSLSTWQVFDKQLKDAEDLNDGITDLKKFYFNFAPPGETPQGVMPLFHAYRKIEQRGILVDEVQRYALTIKYKRQLEECLDDLEKLVGYYVNPNSPKQVGILLYEELKLPPHKHITENGKKVWDTDEDTLEEMWVKELDPIKWGYEILILKCIVKARKLDKILSYLGTPYHPDGRMRCRVKLAGTRSGRTSQGPTNDRILKMAGTDYRFFDFERDEEYHEGKIYELPKNRKKGLGLPFQTVPKHGYEFEEDGKIYSIGDDVRSIYIPTPGYTFVEFDFSQAEARYVAVLAEDWDVIPFFDKPPGIHKLTASWIYECDPFKISKGTKEYDIGKRARHAGNYDMGDFRLAIMAHIPIGEARTILTKFHNASPNIRNVFHLTVQSIVKQHRQIVTPWGRLRQFFGKLDDHLMKEAYSYDPQSTISDNTKFAMLRIMDRCERHGLDNCFVLAETHDSVFSEVRDDFVSEYVDICRQEAQKPIDCRKGSIPRDYQLVIPIEVTYSKTNWLEMQDLKN